MMPMLNVIFEKTCGHVKLQEHCEKNYIYICFCTGHLKQKLCRFKQVLLLGKICYTILLPLRFGTKVMNIVFFEIVKKMK